MKRKLLFPKEKQYCPENFRVKVQSQFDNPTEMFLTKDQSFLNVRKKKKKVIKILQKQTFSLHFFPWTRRMQKQHLPKNALSVM